MTPAGTSNELDVQNGWEENTHTHSSVLVFTYVFVCIVTAVCIVVVYVPSIISSSALLVVSMKELVVIFTYVFECF